MGNEITTIFKEGYLEVSLKGDIYFKDYAQLMQSVGQQTTLPKHLRVLGIDNGIQMKFEPEDTLLLAKVREGTIKKFDSVRHAYVVTDPKKTALAVLTSSSTKGDNYQVKIFSSKAEAKEWLLSK
jgi:hypothetical protein